MKGHENYRVHCRLKEFMAERKVMVEELHERARVSRDTISQLRGNSFKRVSTRAMARICGVLGVGIGELWVVDRHFPDGFHSAGAQLREGDAQHSRTS